MLERQKRGREREGEREQHWEGNIGKLPPVHTPTEDRTGNIALCPDRASNLQPFGVQASDAPARARML